MGARFVVVVPAGWLYSSPMKTPALALALAVLAGVPLSAQEDRPLGTMRTKWAAQVDAGAPLPEYPRPLLVRKDWTNLNGSWKYAIVGRESGRPQSWDGDIVVPFAVESQLSGVRKVVGEDQRLWYRRGFRNPGMAPGKRLFLNFEAVDWHAEVWVNGQKIGEHRGGYDPFRFDITAALTDAAEQEVVVAVWDPTDAGSQPRGKQVGEPRGIWYTAVTGIWGTVWLEEVPELHLLEVRGTGDPSTGKAGVGVVTNAPLPAGAQLAVRVGDRQAVLIPAGAQDGSRYEVPLEIADPRAWSPESPHLYPLQVMIVQGDRVIDSAESYLALRTVGWGKDKHGVNRLFLNGEPIFHYGPLDQGWWPDGLYTAPTDEALRYDLEVTKEMGFNMARKHVKVEPRRWYYWADKLGVMVWQDMPSGFARGSGHNIGRGAQDDAELPEDAARQFLAEWGEIMDDFGGHPSIVAWIPFNEGWGQHRTNEILRWTKEHDPSRLVGGPSGWEDRGFGDLKDMHNYPGPGMFPVMADRVSVLGEFGGLGLPVEGHLWWNKRNWGYRTYQSKEELYSNYESLIRKLDALVPEGLAAAVYTQTTDVEGEVNGLMTYDRLPKFDPEWLAERHAKLYEPAGRVVRHVLAATAEYERPEWSYTFEEPAGGWERPGFQATGWKRGVAGFGTRDTPGALVRTVWNGADLWVRRTFEVGEVPVGQVALRIHHDEDVEVFLNGVELARLEGYTTEYTDLRLDPATVRRALRTGSNVLAIHCHQTRGGQYLDAGLMVIEETDEVLEPQAGQHDHRVLLQGNGKLAIVSGGTVEWEMPWGGIHDLHVLPNGHFMTQRNMREIVEIDPKRKEVVWSYDCAGSNGNAGKRVEVHAFQPLPDGRLFIAESGAGRFIEIDREGRLLKEVPMKLDNPHPHRDTRLARKLENGHYLACHEGDGRIREYDAEGKVVWEYEVPLFGNEPKGGHGLEAWGNAAFAAVRLPNGNTLIATGNGHGVIEVTPEKEIVWRLAQDDLPGIRLAWVTTLEVLPNGNYMIGNCHAGPDNPLLVEIEPATRKVVWTLDEFARFGNSVPNSVLLDLVGKTLR